MKKTILIISLLAAVNTFADACPDWNENSVYNQGDDVCYNNQPYEVAPSVYNISGYTYGPGGPFAHFWRATDDCTCGVPPQQDLWVPEPTDTNHIRNTNPGSVGIGFPFDKKPEGHANLEIYENLLLGDKSTNEWAEFKMNGFSVHTGGDEWITFMEGGLQFHAGVLQTTIFPGEINAFEVVTDTINPKTSDLVTFTGKTKFEGQIDVGTHTKIKSGEVRSHTLYATNGVVINELSNTSTYIGINENSGPQIELIGTSKKSIVSSDYIYLYNGLGGSPTYIEPTRIGVRGLGDNILKIMDDVNGNELIIGTDDQLPDFIRMCPTSGTGLAITGNNNDIGIFVSSGEGANVGIGTTDLGGHKLAVEGIIGARELVVTLDDWSDYVFKEDYDLKSIEELEEYIKKNKHLPGIPSENEVKEKGLSVGEMQAKLLEKVEEMTLYIIQLQKRINELETEKK